MLLNLGIFSHRKEEYLEKYQHTYYTLLVSSEDFDKYMELLNYKSNKYNFVKSNIKRNMNIKTIPFIKEYVGKNIEELKSRFKINKHGYFIDKNNNKIKYSLNGINRLCKSNYKCFTYDNLRTIKNLIDDNLYFKDFPEVQNIYKEITTIIEKNYLYFPVIKKIYSEQPTTVYDFSIPEFHNFYSNGIISHNTILALNITNSLVNQGIPVLYFSFDMGYVTIMDRFLCIREGFVQKDLLNQDKTREQNADIRKALKEFEDIKNFIVYPEGEISLDDFAIYVKKVKKVFRDAGVFKKKHDSDELDEYFICVFDTIDMITDFSGADPSGIKQSINKLHSILRREGLFSINLAQLNENQMRAKKPTDLESVRKIKFTKEDIEGGASYASRSRVVIIGVRPKEMMKSFFPDQEELIALEEDVLILDIDKQNDGNIGRIKPFFVLNTNNYKLYLKREDV